MRLPIACMPLLLGVGTFAAPLPMPNFFNNHYDSDGYGYNSQYQNSGHPTSNGILGALGTLPQFKSATGLFQLNALQTIGSNFAAATTSHSANANGYNNGYGNGYGSGSGMQQPIGIGGIAPQPTPSLANTMAQLDAFRNTIARPSLAQGTNFVDPFVPLGSSAAAPGQSHGFGHDGTGMGMGGSGFGAGGYGAGGQQQGGLFDPPVSIGIGTGIGAGKAGGFGGHGGFGSAYDNQYGHNPFR